MNRYLAAYESQRANAKRRGIEFLLSFKEWCDFWGDDIHRRGRGQFDLQMQRYGDTGPYALGNIKKGTPRQNSATAGVMRRARNCAKAAAEHQADLDRLMMEESGDEVDLDGDGAELAKLGYASMESRRYTYAADF